MTRNALQIGVAFGVVLMTLAASSAIGAQNGGSSRRADAADATASELGFPQSVVALPLGPFPTSFDTPSLWPKPVATAALVVEHLPFESKGWSTPVEAAPVFQGAVDIGELRGSSLLTEPARKQVALDAESATESPTLPATPGTNDGEVSALSNAAAAPSVGIVSTRSEPAQIAPRPVAVLTVPAPVVKAVLILRDGSRIETANYAFVGPAFWSFEGAKSRKFSAADLNLDATVKENRARGIRWLLEN